MLLCEWYFVYHSTQGGALGRVMMGIGSPIIINTILMLFLVVVVVVARVVVFVCALAHKYTQGAETNSKWGCAIIAHPRRHWKCGGEGVGSEDPTQESSSSFNLSLLEVLVVATATTITLIPLLFYGVAVCMHTTSLTNISPFIFLVVGVFGEVVVEGEKWRYRVVGV